MRILLLSAALIGAGSLGGCHEYLDRRETISFGAGDAQQVNLITHVVSPLPSHAADRDLDFHGERMADAVERYRTGEEADPEPASEAPGQAAAGVPGGAAAQ